MRELILFVPGLSGPRGERAAAFEGLPLAALEQLLARADRVETPPLELEPALLHAFGVEEGARHGAGVAPLALLGETGERPAGFWLRADPVHIQAGLDKAVMMGSTVLGLSRAEADALCAEIGAQMAAEGLGPRAVAPSRWYVRWPQAPRARFSPLPEVVGADLYPHLPEGEEGRAWRGLLNHAQMALHASPVNARRRAEGRPEVNGLWFWGGGELPAPRACGYAGVWADDPLARGLALNAGVPAAPLPDGAGDWLRAAGAGRHLMAVDRLREPLRLADLETWRARLQELHARWFAPLRDALRAGGLDRLRICPGDGGGYDISRRSMRWRWWRRARPLY